MKKPTEIIDTKTKNNVIEGAFIQTGQFIKRKQIAEAIDDGEHTIHKGNDVQSVDGKYIRSKPNKTTKDNLKPD